MCIIAMNRMMLVKYRTQMQYVDILEYGVLDISDQDAETLANPWG